MAVSNQGGFSLGQTFRSLKNPAFRLFYGFMLGQMAAANMRMMARSLLIYRLTGSAALLGALALAHSLPDLIFSLYGGVLADRLEKKHVLFVGQAVAAIVSLGIALSLSLGYMSAERAGSWWILMAASVIEGTIMGLTFPSRQAIVREIVSGEQLMNAVALNTLGMNTLRLLAPALTGFLIDAFDFQAIYFAMTGLYLWAMAFISLVPRTGTRTSQGSSALADIKEGFQYIRHQANIISVLLFTLFAIILSMPYMYMMPIFADDVLDVGASGMGILLSFSGVGAILGSLTLASLPNKKRGAMLIVSALILGAALAGFSFSHWWYPSLALVALVGLGQAGRMTLANTLLMYYVDDKYRGRVIGIYEMEFGLTSFGTFSVGLLAEAVGVQWALGGAGMILTFLSVMALVFLRRLRKLD